MRVIKWRRLRWAGHVARMGEERGVYRVLVGKLERRRPLGRHRRRWVDNFYIYIYLFILHAPLLWAMLHALVVSYTVTNVHLIILTFLDKSLSSYLLGLYSLSNDRLSVNFLNSLLYLLISVCLLTGRFSDRSTAALTFRRLMSTIVDVPHR